MSDRVIHERSMPLEMRREGAGGLTVDGYATTFDDPYPVTDQLGTYMESFARGAFKKTLSERKPVMQFDHGADALFGNLTIGTWDTIEETDHGLHVVGRLHDTWHTEPIRAAIDEGSLTSMSIRFSAVKQDPDDFGAEHDERTILEARLYEMGPVVFPANEGTSIMLRTLSAHLSEDELASLVGTTKPAVGTDLDAAAAITPPVGADAHAVPQPLRTGITAQQRQLWALKRSQRRR